MYVLYVTINSGQELPPERRLSAVCLTVPGVCRNICAS